jgi:hydroxymethylpyrimidine pyrophosphatase-like HAD family hydrolase
VYFIALATDYDGTLAAGGHASAEAVKALERFKDTGRRLILVTGRELAHVKEPFPRLEIFDRVVAENGAVIYDPASKKEIVIGAGPPPAFVERLRQLNVTPLSIGRCIVATWEPHQATVLEAIRELGLEHQIIFNKGAVMVLPPGINKATGLKTALKELGLSYHNVVGVGDAENDQAFLHHCGCAAAVANALPTIQKAAHVHLTKDHGDGVIELIERICRDDAGLAPAEVHGILLGMDGLEPLSLKPFGGNILIAGKSGIGKSTLATALTEQMSLKRFQFCVFDPEGDYDDLENAVSVGDAKVPPVVDEALKLMEAGTNVVVNTQNLNVGERSGFFADMLPRVSAQRKKTGRPHWLVIDEAHHLLPAKCGDAGQTLNEEVPAVILVTVHPESVSAEVLKSVNTIVALGQGDVIVKFCEAVGEETPSWDPPGEDEVIFWERRLARPRLVNPKKPLQTHKRHTRKYAEGALGEDRSFYFRGPDNQLNLRAQNLILFVQIANGVDDSTWMHHLRRGDYSAWFREVIKDRELADEAANIENDHRLNAQDSRKKIGDAVMTRYTAPVAQELE